VVRPWADRPVWDRVGLQVRASEAAFAVGRTSRAIAYLEVAIGGLDTRGDRVRLGLLHERLANVRRAAGDVAGAIVDARRAVELVPREPSPARARVLASLAQLTMLDGIFSDAQRTAREAIDVARACEPVARQHEVHAMTTLGVAMAWGSDPSAAIDLLREAEVAARELDDQDALFRVRANLTTVLDLVARRSEAVDVAKAGIEEARQNGLEAVYGNFLAGNAAESLFLLGRWQEARELCTRALGWLPVGVAFLHSVIQLASVEIEMEAGEEAARLLGQTVLEFDALREPQLAGAYYLAAASFSLWRGDIADASRSAGRGWAVVKETEEWVLVARLAAMVAQVDAAAAVEAREHRQLAPLAAARERTANVVSTAVERVRVGGAPASAGSRQVADAHLATARAFQRRLEGDDDARVWAHVAEAWYERSAPYEVALARWRQAEASLGGGSGRSGRADARKPLLAATKAALKIEARPLLRALRELAGRARIQLPDEVDAFLAESTRQPVAVQVATNGAGGSDGHGGRSELVLAVAGAREAVVARGDTFGLSSREREVLLLVAEGRTNREIGEHLFISQKTVGVHVGNILAKLSVSGRVEAAAVAIRLGLTDPR
jgi:DNA-binding CsgD family transcriptional regulator/tetratricopeptide (TPR) repeat protein